MTSFNNKFMLQIHGCVTKISIINCILQVLSLFMHIFVLCTHLRTSFPLFVLVGSFLTLRDLFALNSREYMGISTEYKEYYEELGGVSRRLGDSFSYLFLS